MVRYDERCRENVCEEVIFTRLGILGFFSLSIAALHAQHFNGYHGRLHTNESSSKFYPGFFITIEKDTLFGDIQMSKGNNIWFIPTKRSQYEHPEMQMINEKSILALHLSGCNTNYTKVEGKKKLYRVLFEGKVSMFDRQLFCEKDRLIYWGMLIVKGGIVDRVRAINNKTALIKRVNKLFGQHFAAKDFKDRGDIVDWILQHADDK